MSLYQINRNPNNKGSSDDKQTGETNQSSISNQTNNNNIDSTTTNNSNTDINTINDDKQNAGVSNQNNCDKTIIIDGPLSEVFTQGLIKFYSKDASNKENQSAETIAQDSDIQSKLLLNAISDDVLNNNKPDLYVYVDDGDTFNGQKGLELIRTIENLKERNIEALIVLQSNCSNLNKYMCATENYAYQNKVDVLHVPNMAYRYIHSVFF